MKQNTCTQRRAKTKILQIADHSLSLTMVTKPLSTTTQFFHVLKKEKTDVFLNIYLNTSQKEFMIPINW